MARLNVKFEDNTIDIKAVNALKDIQEFYNLSNYKDTIKQLIFEKHKRIKKGK